MRPDGKSEFNEESEHMLFLHMMGVAAGMTSEEAFDKMNSEEGEREICRRYRESKR